MPNTKLIKQALWRRIKVKNAFKMKYLFSLSIIFCSLFSQSQTPRFLDSTLLINGNGTVHYLGSNSKHFGFTTYKNGHPNGLFNFVDSTGEILLTGNLKYDTSCVVYHPATRYKLVMGKDTVSGKLFTNTFEAFAPNANGIFIEKLADSLAEGPEAYTSLGIGFSEDPAIVPVGKWQLILLDKKRVYKEIELDDCGNTVRETYYNEDGSIHNQLNYPAVTTKKRKSLY